MSLTSQPHINGPRATPYLTWHQNWQTRIFKERLAAMPDDMVEKLWRPPGLPGGPGAGPPGERCPIGGSHRRNNSSAAFARTFGPHTWDGSGGLKSSQRTHFGNPYHNGAHVSKGMGRKGIHAECGRALPTEDVDTILRKYHDAPHVVKSSSLPSIASHPSRSTPVR
mmetsp:Transcript_127143/g.359870  ORF Transcript_127143/g.359870 Transcript_127143/m.359870 type:complete len:167 (+) Transcript_127143:68-568(+)